MNTIHSRWKKGLSPGRITVIYLIVGAAWIFLTSFLVSEYSHEVQDAFFYELCKGLFFVVATGFLLWILCRIWERQLARESGERAQTMRKLDESRMEAEQASRAKSDFLAVMSHEFRTPLNPIMGYASMLLEESKDEEQREAIREILGASGRMLHLIDDLLFFSHFSEREIADQLEGFELRSLIEESLEETRRSHPDAEIRLENGFGTFETVGEDNSLVGYPELLKRVVHELLSNAIKFGEANPIFLRFGLRNQENGENLVRIEVEDSGIGISEALLEKIFTPFELADTSKTRRFEGVGLGLATCRKISEFMSADLSARSRVGEGSQFSFQFSLSGETAGTGRTLGDRSIKVREFQASGGPVLARESRPKVLVVEDDPANGRVMRRFLDRWNLRMEIALNGQVAVEKCAAEKFDLILMDLFMPVMNGFEAGKRILEAGAKNADTPIVALSAQVGADTRSRCLEIGMRDCLSKPIGVEEMRGVLADLGLLD